MQRRVALQQRFAGELYPRDVQLAGVWRLARDCAGCAAMLGGFGGLVGLGALAVLAALAWRHRVTLTQEGCDSSAEDTHTVNSSEPFGPGRCEENESGRAWRRAAQGGSNGRRPPGNRRRRPRSPRPRGQRTLREARPRHFPGRQAQRRPARTPGPSWTVPRGWAADGRPARVAELGCEPEWLVIRLPSASSISADQ